MGKNAFRKRRRWPLERAAAAAAILIVSIAAAAIIVPMWIAGERETAALSERMNAAVVDDTRREIDSLFNRVSALQETARSLIAAGAVDIDDRTAREALFMGLLRAESSISWVSLGFDNGDFYGANRRDLGRLRMVESLWDENVGQARRLIDYYVEYEGAVYKTHSKVRKNDYHAAARSWFKAAMGADGAVWTDVYRFASSGRPGLNTAVQVKRGGRTIGVVSIALELDRLDAWLADRMSAREGVAFILGPEGEVLAASEAPTSAADTTATGLLPSPAESGRPMLQILAPALADRSQADVSRAVISDPAFGGAAYLNLTPLGALGWQVGTLLPESAFAADVQADRRRMLAAALAAVALVACIAIALTRLLFVEPLQAAARHLARFQRFDLSSRRPLKSSIDEIAALGDGLEGARRSLAAFARYAPAELARDLLSDGAQGGPLVERRTITVLFLDLEGFTSATERLGHRLAPQLNVFLEAMTVEVREAGGVVDKFIGDAVMALFGAPDADENHALNACRAALGCIAALDRLNQGWAQEGKPTFRMRVGVNTGRVLVGSIGAPDRLNYTALGDPVNLAARLEGLNKTYGTSAMIGPQTYDLVKYDATLRRLDMVRVKGKTERLPVYELISLAGDGSPERPEWIAKYEDGLDLMAESDVRSARERFDAAIALRGEDPPSAAMLRKLAPPKPGRDPAFERLENAAADI